MKRKSVLLGIPLIGLLMGGMGLIWISWTARGTLASLIDSSPDYESLKHIVGERTVEAMKAISSKRLRSNIVDLQHCGERSSWEKQDSTSRYLFERLHGMGLHPEVQEYPYNDRAFKNLIVTYPGQVQPDSRLLAVAHYDSINRTPGLPCPGADDDATGVSALLELAQLISTIERRHTWQLIFFSNEEQGRKGSIEYARRSRQAGIDIAGVVSLDILGYHPPGLSELMRVARSSMDAARKLKGVAKVIGNAYLAQRSDCASLNLAFRAEELPLAPKAQVRTALGPSFLWELGGACP